MRYPPSSAISVADTSTSKKQGLLVLVEHEHSMTLRVNQYKSSRPGRSVRSHDHTRYVIHISVGKLKEKMS